MGMDNVLDSKAASSATGTHLQDDEASALLDQLVERAETLGIQTAGTASKRNMVSSLLDDIESLLLARETSCKALTTHTSGHSDQSSASAASRQVQHTWNADETSGSVAGGFDYTFDNNFYNDSEESRFCSQLLDVRQKLRYEIATINDLLAGRPKDRSKLEDCSSIVQLSRVTGGHYVQRYNEDHGEPSQSDTKIGDLQTEPADDASGTVTDEDPESTSAQTAGETALPADPNKEPCWVTIHRVWCTASGGISYFSFHLSNEKHTTHPACTHFLEPPHHVRGDTPTSELRGSRQIFNVKEFLSQRPEVAFVVYKNYDCKKHSTDLLDKATSQSAEKAKFACDQPVATCVYEDIEIVSDPMKNAMTKLVEIFPADTSSHWFDISGCMQQPYLALFHYQDLIQERMESVLDTGELPFADLLLNFAKDTKDFRVARDLLSRSVITADHFSKLFRPGDVIVKGYAPVEAYRCIALPKLDLPLFKLRSSSYVSLASVEVQTGSSKCEVKVESWCFDGNLRLKGDVLTCYYPTSFPIYRIGNLSQHPLQFGDDDMERLLERRGRTFWGCRKKSYIAYDAPLSMQTIQSVRPATRTPSCVGWLICACIVTPKIHDRLRYLPQAASGR